MPATADRPDHSTPSVEASLPPDPRNQAVSETGAAALKTAPLGHNPPRHHPRDSGAEAKGRLSLRVAPIRHLRGKTLIAGPHLLGRDGRALGGSVTACAASAPRSSRAFVTAGPIEPLLLSHVLDRPAGQKESGTAPRASRLRALPPSDGRGREGPVRYGLHGRGVEVVEAEVVEPRGGVARGEVHGRLALVLDDERIAVECDERGREHRPHELPDACP